MYHSGKTQVHSILNYFNRFIIYLKKIFILCLGILTFHFKLSRTIAVSEHFQSPIHHTNVEQKINCSGLLLCFPSASCFNPADYEVNCNKCTDPNSLKREIKLEPTFSSINPQACIGYEMLQTHVHSQWDR